MVSLFFLIVMVIFPLTGCSDSATVSTTQPIVSYPISSEVFTTRQRAIVADVPSGSNTILPWEIAKFKENGYGNWHYESGVDYGKQTDIMPAGYDSISVTNTARLLNFFTISDIHITDKETPVQLIYLAMIHTDACPSSLYSPIMLYTTHVLDAAIQTVNALHRQKPFDCGISLGDACNSTQYNELRWYIDVIDGRFITPSSGAHLGADTIDYQKPYKTAGLNRTIPWYQTIGNHDHIWITSQPDSYLQQTYTGEDILQLGDVLIDPAGLNERTYYMGTLDGNTPYGDIIGAGPVSTTPAIKIAADQYRRSLKDSGREWMNEFFNTSSNPVGHGYTQTNIDTGVACYSFEPRSDIPLKVIMLDDTMSDTEPDNTGNAHGSLDKTRYDWLVSELDRGQAEGKLMVIAAHVPIGVLPPGSEMGWSTNAYVSEPELVATLHNYPNLIMWIAGHRHCNQVTAFKSPDPNHPELGFWEVETASLRDFPQQFRTFELVRNNDNTISIIITDVDPAVTDGSPAAISRSYAIAAMEIYKSVIPLPPTYAYNAELIKQLSPEMQNKIQSYGTPIR